MNRRWSERWRQGRRGTVTVEMALVLPIFTMLVFGIIEFGRGFMIMQLVTNAAREGCRRAIIDGSTNAEVTSYIQTFMQTSGNVSPSATTVTITVTPAPGNPANSGNSLAACQSRDLVTIKVQIPFSAVQLISAKYLAGKTLAGDASMRHE
ncbi:MAG: TadE/TadG family type IV pilus assembly protein [Planctomycetaceae bacterium]